MPVRSTMTDLITRIRVIIADTAGSSQQFSDQDIQDYLDDHRDDIRYEQLKMAPSIVNTASTNNQATTIFADYYSDFEWWESDIVLQGYFNGAAWVVLTPTSSDYITGHWMFENNVFTTGTAPGQLPPVFATGKVYDRYGTAADMLEFWAASLAGAYDITVDGQSLKRSQLMQAKMTLAQQYRRKARPRVIKQVRHDVRPSISTREVRLLDSDSVMKGA